MPDTPLNPDALEVAVRAFQKNANAYMQALYTSDEVIEDAITAYLAVAQPEVNSVEELDALPAGSLVRTADGREYYKRPLYDYPWTQGRQHNGCASKYLAKFSPVTVIHRPEVKP